MSLIVEDGLGDSDAESYISVADAAAYIGLFYLPTDPLYLLWTNASTATQEVVLRRSTRDLDAVYGTSYLSTRLTATQALLFPRQPFYEYGQRNQISTDGSGYFYEFPSNNVQVTGIPAALGQAVAELALILLNGTDITGPTDRTGALERDYNRAGGVLSEQSYFYPASIIAQNTRKVAALIAPFLSIDPFGLNVSLVRG